MATWMRRILVVDDEALLRSLISTALSRHGFDVRAAASAAAAAVVADEFDPDLVLLDVELGDGPSGLDLGTRLAVTHPDVPIIFLTRFADPDAVLARGGSMPAGGIVVRKEIVQSEESLLALLETRLRGRGAPSTPSTELLQLTRAQVEVLRLAAAGMTNASIAAHRGTSARAVELALQGVYARLGITDSQVNSRVAAIARYVELAGRPSLSRESTASP